MTPDEWQDHLVKSLESILHEMNEWPDTDVRRWVKEWLYLLSKGSKDLQKRNALLRAVFLLKLNINPYEIAHIVGKPVEWVSKVSDAVRCENLKRIRALAEKPILPRRVADKSGLKLLAELLKCHNPRVTPQLRCATCPLNLSVQEIARKFKVYQEGDDPEVVEGRPLSDKLAWKLKQRIGNPRPDWDFTKQEKVLFIKAQRLFRPLYDKQGKPKKISD